MTNKLLPALVLVAAVAAVVATVTWAVTGKADHPRTAVGSESMMGYVPEGPSRPARDLADAERQAQSFADRLDLRVGEVLQFKNNYYAALLDREGKGATEVLVNPRNGAVGIEYGPAMMWNTEYGMMGSTGMMGSAGMMGDSGGGMMGSTGMMGGAYGDGMMGSSGGGMMDSTGIMGGAYGGGMMGSAGMMGGSYGGGMMGGSAWAEPDVGAAATVSPEEAMQMANRWLGTRKPGLLADEADTFPGYYTLEARRGDTVAGMLSVNASTGAVWYHWWHGPFVAMTE